MNIKTEHDFAEIELAKEKVRDAAPELLAAAQIWLDHYDEFVRQDGLGDERGIPELRTAIAKATQA